MPSKTAQSAEVHVEWHPGFPDRLRRCTLHVDGVERGALEAGNDLGIAVETGLRELEVVSGSTRSNPIALTARPGERVVLQCGEPRKMPVDIGTALKGLGFPFLLWPAFDLALAFLARGYALAQPNNARARRDPLQALADALAAFEESLAQGRDDPLAHYHCGRLKADLGHSEAEICASFDRAIALRPDYAEAHLQRGLSLASDPERSLRAIDRALQLDPVLVDAHHRRGELLETLGRFDEAITAFDRALELDSELNEVARRRRELNRSMGRPDPLDENFGALFIEEVRKLQGGYGGLPFSFIQQLRSMNRADLLGTSQAMVVESRNAERYKRLQEISPAEFAKAFLRRFGVASMEHGSSLPVERIYWNSLRSTI